MLYSKLWDYQKGVVDLALEVKTLAVFAEQRTGKTYMTGGVIEKLIQKKGKKFRGVVGVPLTNKLSTWKKFFKQYLPGVKILTEWPGKREFDKIQGPVIVLAHHQYLAKITKYLKNIHWTFIGIDESQVLKDRGSLISRRARQLRDCAEYKLIMSGTPIEQQPQDTWAQFRFLNPDLLGDDWANFESDFLKRAGYMGYKRKFRQEKLKTFLKIIKPYAIRITKEQVGIKGPKIKVVEVELLELQRKLYKRIGKEMGLTYKGREVSADLKMTMRAKRHQICGGGLIDDEGEVIKLPCSKIKAIKKLVARNQGPFVVFCKYRHEIERLHRLFSKRLDCVEMLTGKVKDKKNDKVRTKLLKRFQRGEIDMLICQTRTGGVGVDLYTSNCAIVYSTTHSYLDNDQLAARLNHKSKKKPPLFFVLIAKKTVDVGLNKGLISKKSVSESVLTKLQRSI